MSYGMELRKDVIFPALAEVLRADGQEIRGIYERNDVPLREREGLEEGKGWYRLPGEAPPAQYDDPNLSDDDGDAQPEKRPVVGFFHGIAL